MEGVSDLVCGGLVFDGHDPPWITAPLMLIASTEDERHQLSRFYGASRDRLRTIHPGVNHARFRPVDRAAARWKLGLDSSEPVLLCVARVYPLKGLIWPFVHSPAPYGDG